MLSCIFAIAKMPERAYNKNMLAVYTALTYAAAMEILAPRAGKRWCSVCVWYLHRLDPTESAPARRAGGDCLSCPYTGRDVFVALLPYQH
jgi:hypothetical protein